MKDQIILADEWGQPEKLGWTKLGPIDRDDCWQNTGWVYCKGGEFVVFNEAGPDMEFKGFLEQEEAMQKLFERYDADFFATLESGAYSHNQRKVKGLE